jgi:hypothetical protein
MCRAGGDSGNVERGGVRGEDGVARLALGELVDEGLFVAEVLADGLHDQRALRQRTHRLRREQQVGGPACLVVADPALRRQLAQGGSRPVHRRRGHARDGVDQVHLVAGQGGDLGDARAHGPGPDDAHDDGLRVLGGGLPCCLRFEPRLRHVTKSCRPALRV